MKRLDLIPNTSLGEFILGANIKEYNHIPHHIVHHNNDRSDYYSYEFEKYGIVLWVDEKNNINTIRSTKECFWENENLIKMSINEFLIHFHYIPDSIETYYVPINEDRGQNQTVYEFNHLGLMIWVWRQKIRTVIISNYNSLEDE